MGSTWKSVTPLHASLFAQSDGGGVTLALCRVPGGTLHFMNLGQVIEIIEGKESDFE